MSRTVTITLPHTLGETEARRRVSTGVEKLHTALGSGLPLTFESDWTSATTMTFKAQGLGQNITGRLDILPEAVRIDILLPDVLAGFAETIFRKVEDEGRLLLGPK